MATPQPMPPSRVGAHSRVIFLLLAGLSLLILSASCAAPGEVSRPEPERGFGQIVLYVSVPAASEAEVAFTASAVDARPAEGEWRRVSSAPLRLDSEAMRGQQVLLAERTLPAGQYGALRVFLQEGVLKRKGKPATLALPEGGYVDYPIAFRVRAGQATTLLISWYPDDSVAEGFSLRPAFSAQTSGGTAESLQVYVTNEGSNSVSVIDRQTGEVVKTVQVGAAPKGIAFGRFEARTKIFVANSGDNSLSVIDPVAGVVEQTVPIRFGERPEDVVVYAGVLRGGAIYVANNGSQNLSIVDPILLREIERVQVGRGPVALAIDPPLDTATGARGLAFADLNLWQSYRQQFFHVYVANQLSNTVTVVVCRVSDGRAERTAELKVEFSPSGLAVDGARAKVYVANQGSNNLSVIDIIQFIRGRESDAVSTITNVGVGGVAVAPDPFFERLYLLRAQPPEVDFIQTAPTSLRGLTTPVLSAVRVDASPRRMVIDPEGRKLYVTCQGSDSVNIVDKTSRKVEQVAKVGRRPYAVTIIP